MDYPTISMKELDCWIMCSRPMELIDLRNSKAYDCFHLQGAVNIPYEELMALAEAGSLECSGDIPMVLYCARGSLSMLACNRLSARGYAVINTAGGLAAYRGKHLIR